MLKNLGQKKKQEQAIETVRASVQEGLAEDEDSYDSEDEYSDENDFEEYMIHMDEQMAELKEMIVQLTTGANARSSRIERRLNFALRRSH